MNFRMCISTICFVTFLSPFPARNQLQAAEQKPYAKLAKGKVIKKRESQTLTLEVKDCFAYRVESKNQIRVFCFPYILNEEDIAKLSKGPGYGPSFRNNKGRNPDPSLWEVAPLVVYDVQLDKPEIVSLENLKIARFISWMQRIPGTINRSNKKKNEYYQELKVVEEKGEERLILKSKCKDGYGSTLYDWDVELDVKLITVER